MESPSEQRRLRELLEVSRPGDLAAGSDDAQRLAADPQLRLAFDRIQGWDAALRSALDQLEVPASLEQRILARLSADSTLGGSIAAAIEAADATAHASNTPATVSSAAVTPATGANEAVAVEPARKVRPLTYWSSVGAAAIAAATLVVAAGYWLQLGSEVPIDQLAQQWHAELADEWQPIDQAPANFPFPEAMRVAATGWQWIGKRTRTPVVAYRLTSGKNTARLYAASMKREGLGVAPPAAPQQDTGGKAIGYWRSPRNESLVYVLVVDDSKQYRAFVRSASTPLAVLLPFRFDTPPALLPRPSSRARKIA